MFRPFLGDTLDALAEGCLKQVQRLFSASCRSYALGFNQGVAVAFLGVSLTAMVQALHFYNPNNL